ncbi:uncharacterized protein LOC106071990 [Biomphalaria glabrata]|uniref:Uncharacterized protein LOC106071990 n=1 Tax=Biomphalaria glabrata TaxID=6526 RepID=A0A2C9LJX1_BIOGL|nr:uncharacterized protein LOC106071990 [Biomphalaria glabrata]KAI8777891.1 hypothetical protein BgiBS90_022094 [Biomphalaria glabrata]
MWLRTVFLCNLVFLYTSLARLQTSKSRKGCASLRTCLDPFPMLVDLIQKDKAGALATLTYGVLLDSVCSKQMSLNECISKSPCDIFNKYYVSHAVRDTLEFICGEGRDVLLSEAGCFSRDDFEWGAYQCSRAMRLESDIATLQLQTTVNLAKQDKPSKTVTGLCGVFQNLLNCIHINVERTCSKKAANFTRSVFKKTVGPFAKELGCSLK